MKPMTNPWSPPSDWIRITTLEAHTAGEPLRIFTGGIPPIPGPTILEKRRFAMHELDALRTTLIWEPRGHADMYGAILTEPVTEDGDCGVLFLHNEGFSTMCGHGILGLAMAGIEAGVVPVRTEQGPDTLTLRLDTPAGRVTAFARKSDGRVREASFLNVPSFVYALDQRVEVPGVGSVRYDVAFGGAFYAFCREEDLGVPLKPESFRQLMELGMAVKRGVMASLPIRHPFEEDLGFLYGTIIVGEPENPENHSRNVCVFAEGEVDRSPTGTGVSARAALHYFKGELALGESFTVESVIGTTFTGQVVETVSFGPHDAVVPRISGTSHITGRNEILVDPEDPLRYGFMLR
jgi:trans-L-3-hydroxyproline dehydratase